MPSSVAINFSAKIVAGSGVSRGMAVVLNGPGTLYQPAITANLASGVPISGVCVSTPDDSGSFEMQYTAEVPNFVTNLGPGAASPVVVNTATGFLMRKSQPTYGVDYVMGDCHPNGDVMLTPGISRLFPPTSGVAFVNLLSWGGKADATVNGGLTVGGGLATDNSVAFDAAILAINASGLGSGVLYIPGNSSAYYCSREVESPGVPIKFKGDEGDEFAPGGGMPTQFVFPAYNALDGGKRVKRSCFRVSGAAGHSFENIVVWGAPNSQTWRQWNSAMPDATFNLFVTPSYPQKWAYHATNGNPAIKVSQNEPVWGVDFDIDTRMEIGAFFFIQIIDALNPNNLPWRYTVTAGTGNQKQPEEQGQFMPFAGIAPIATTGSTFTAADVGNTSVRPSNAQFNASNGSLYTVFAITGTSVTLTSDPTGWSTAALFGATFTVAGTGGTVTFKNAQPCFPRAVGLSCVVINGANTLTYTLTDTSGLFIDPNNTGVGGGQITWEVLPQWSGIQCLSTTSMKNVTVTNTCNNFDVTGGVGSASDLWRMDRCISAHSVVNGFNLQGGDANIGAMIDCQALDSHHTYIRDNTFLGMRLVGGQISPAFVGQVGRWSVLVMQAVAASSYNDFYIEGAIGPPAWFRAGETRTRKGNWQFYPSVGIIGKSACDDTLSTHNPRQFTSGPLGNSWVGGQKTYVGDTVIPSNVTFYRIVSVTSVSYPGARKSVQPTWPTAVGSTITETSTTVATISGCTGLGVSPIELTFATAHAYTTGDQVTVTGVGGNTNANVTCLVVKTGPTKLTLTGTTPNANWTSGGTVTRTDSITYTIGGPRHSTLIVGNDTDPQRVWEAYADDVPTLGSTTGFGLMGNAPFSGEWGYVYGGNPGNCPQSFGIDADGYYARFLYRIKLAGAAGPILTTGTAPPSTGTWTAGSKCWNSAPAIGQPKGWVCTVAGTGLGATWVSEGNL